MNYPANLCTLSIEQQQAIEDDKHRWFVAYQKIHTLKRADVRRWLASLVDDAEYHEDMRRRLNIIDQNRAKKLQAATEAMRKGLKEAKTGE